MVSRWLRLGIRTQLMVVVMIGTILTTGVILFITDNSIRNYGLQQEQNQENRNLKVASLVLKTQFGNSISISADNQMVIDSPDVDKQTYTNDPTYNLFGKLPLNTQTAFVDQVHGLLDGNEISVFQCANQLSQLTVTNGLLICPRISTTLLARDAKGNLRTISIPNPNSPNGTYNTDREISSPDHAISLSQSAIAQMQLTSGNPQHYTGTETIGGISYLASYQPLLDPNGHTVGVLSVAEPLTAVTQLIDSTTLAVIVSSIVVMVSIIVLALLVTSAISGTLQRATIQLIASSTQLSGIAGQQAGGSRQQVWAINAINQALHNLEETSTDVSRRTDQLAQIGSQVAVRRSDISPAQFESVMAYMTRSVRDISVASHQQTTTIERMSGAMQAVVEIADQVAGNSQQTSESTKRLDQVVTELRQLVTGRGDRSLTPNRRKRSASRATDTAVPDMMMTGDTRSGPMGSGPLPGAPSRPRTNNASMPRAATSNGPMPRPYTSGPEAARSTQMPNSRPMLPGPQRNSPRPPRERDGAGWETGQDDPRTFGTGHGAQAPWSEFRRNQE